MSAINPIIIHNILFAFNKSCSERKTVGTVESIRKRCITPVFCEFCNEPTEEMATGYYCHICGRTVLK